MNKAVLFLLGFGMFSMMSAQKQDKLSLRLEREKVENQQKIENYISKQGRDQFTEEEINKMRANVAGFIGDRPYFWQTDDLAANRAANVVALQNGTLTGLNGQMIDGLGQNIMVMDGGRVFDKHVDFGATAGVPPVPPRVFDLELGTVGYNFHATNVAGIIGSEGIANVQDIGVLKKVQINSYSFSTTPQGTNYQKLAASPNANISNHSYGVVRGWRADGANWYWEGDYLLSPTDTWSGAYVSNDASYDAIVYDNQNQIVVKSAGNYFGDGPSGSYFNAFKFINGSWVPFTSTDIIPPNNCSGGFNCIGWGSVGKNVIIVGATNRLTTLGNVYTQPSDVVKAGFSSAGPRKDGAIKPDIAATGVSMVMPTYTNATTYNAVSTSGQGTSYSAPVISGIAGALTHIKRNLSGNASFMFKADEMKALLMHSTNEAGPNPGPDAWFGWGFADATKGAQVLIDNAANKNTFQRNLMTSGTPYNRTVVAQAGSPIKATISWVDPEGVPFTNSTDMWQNRTPRLINDFDLKIIDMVTNEVTYPWKLNALDPMAAATKGDNVVDNIEQVLLESPVGGRQYRIEVSNKGTLKNDAGVPAPQNYALIVTGYDFTATNQLSVTDVDPKDAVAVYPTATEDYVTVVVPLKADHITMHDMSGKLIVNVKAKDTQMIDMRSLPKGVYLINIKTESGNVTKKVIRK